jgi:type IV pilus assembly protein PilB
MSGFQSIDDLIKKEDASGDGSQKPSVQNSQVKKPVVQAKFQKKMKEVGLKEKEVETKRFAEEIGIAHINLEKLPISQVALRQLTEERAKETATICFFATREEVRVGAIDPTTDEAKEILAEIQEKNGGAHGEMYTISEQSFNHIIDLYKNLPTIKAISKDVEVKQEDLEQVKADVTNFDSFQELLNKKSTTDLMTFVMGAGLKLKASDVHIEAEEEKIAVRFRMDGMLHDAAELPRAGYKKLISRIKLLASLKINISDKPQDGRFTVKLPDGDVDVRVSTIPTVYGESIVMRLLVQHQKTITLDSLGIRGRAYDMLMREIQRPNGMIITTGPTGSGKTTTLYAVMHLLNKSNVKIITLEDPVEYKMEGINQSQIDKSHEYTFAKGLRSMMRQDPDIAMVGEIRDLETAEIAVQAALTGHLMLSTIHTNDAFGAIPRFLSIGVKAFLLAPSLNCVIGQRLVRKLCESCKAPTEPTPEMQQRITTALSTLPEPEKKELEQKELAFFTAKGCEACNNIGYAGQIGIYEIFVISKEVEEAILAGNVAEHEIRKIATEHGTVTMVQDGLLKAIDGITSAEEIFRVTE